MLFVDVVGFTPLAQRLSAEDLVVLLDRVFRELDALSERYGLEKIKTVGDADIAVAGLPVPMEAEASAVAAAEMALEVFPAVRSGRAASTARCGCGSASTPVRAVVGGSSAGASSPTTCGGRRERRQPHGIQGLPDRIQVSLDTYVPPPGTLPVPLPRHDRGEGSRRDGCLLPAGPPGDLTAQPPDPEATRAPRASRLFTVPSVSTAAVDRLSTISAS